MGKLTITLTVVALFGCALDGAFAQTQTPPTQPAAAQPAAAPTQQLLKAEELDRLAAPIALYPDTLASTVLMASTYPLEVVMADRWATRNKNSSRAIS